jgi:hypothetical protein
MRRGRNAGLLVNGLGEIKMKQKLGFVIVTLLGFLNAALAQGPSYPRNITLTATAPSQYTDGTQILSTDGLTLEATCTRNDGTVVLDRAPFGPVLPGAEVSTTFPDAVPNSGTYTCQAFAVVDSISSDPSNDAAKRYTGQPGAPVIIVFAE